MPVLSTAVIGTATSAPMIPASTTPVAMATITASGWIATAFPMIAGWSTCPSNCCTPTTTSRTSSATRGPRATRATRIATVPDRVAPMIGMNAPRNTSAANGNANGTRSTTRPMPIPVASMNATRTVARTYATRVCHDCSPALPSGSRPAAGSRLTRNRQIRRPSRRKKNVVNSTRNSEASTSMAVPAVDKAPVVSMARWSLSHWLAAVKIELSCLSDRCSGPRLSQPWICWMPASAFWLSSCQLFTNCVITRVSVPTTMARPPIITIAVARERCMRTRLRSQPTAGDSSAESRREMATGTSTWCRRPTTQSTASAATATMSSRQDQAAAIRSGYGTCWSSPAGTSDGGGGAGIGSSSGSSTTATVARPAMYARRMFARTCSKRPTPIPYRRLPGTRCTVPS